MKNKQTLLRVRRRLLGLSQVDLARRAGMDPSRLSLAERGLVPILDVYRGKLAEALGVPADLIDRTINNP